jgi:hypothetical protein
MAQSMAEGYRETVVASGTAIMMEGLDLCRIILDDRMVSNFIVG